MIYLEGIRFTADSTEELHKQARKVVLSKSWFQPFPDPHYAVICPHKQDAILALIEKYEKKNSEKFGN